MSVNIFGAVAVHILALGIMSWGYFGLESTVMNTFIVRQKGGHFQFLTIQALAMAWITMALSLCSDIIPTSRLLKQMKRAFFMIALPVSVVVTVIYWSLLFFLPGLILQTPPAVSEPSSEPFSSNLPGPARIPLSLDLALHATPAITLLVDFFAFERSYDALAVTHGAPAMAFAFGTWYSLWVEYCASFNKKFRIAIYATVTSVAFLSFRGINAVHLRLTCRDPLISKKKPE
ncbi:hypothetical protein EW145_g6816 [Phellinidium pouzarii]|uniref:FAR-17a/AIG1-like protein n=1 Tax=Phellinidium pouzarii TaxID=167371 RepID=A0A4S4KTP6_9AGAM|nr:hypothetical protein EW145_g6816 [Phellinidium pouzarii]